MRKVFLEDLPRRAEGIDWTSSVGRKVKFVYDDIDGEIVLLDYDKSKTQLTVSYSGKETKTYTRRLKAGEISAIIGLMTFEFKFNIGDVINGVEILNTTRINRKTGNRTEKGYVVRCAIDGYVYDVFETDLVSGKGCPVCVGKKVVIGINDIATTCKEMIPFLLNKEDAYKYTKTSSKKIMFKCIHCNHPFEKQISNVYYQGFSCGKCGDGISYPNKFMYNLLTQLNVEFIAEYSPNWAIDETGRQRRYDFYIPSRKLIIEMDGGIGHGNSEWSISKEESLRIDRWKDYIALINDIKVIRICSNYSDDRFNYICETIKSSDIKNMFELSSIDFTKCHEYSVSTLVKEACELWCTGRFNSTKELGKFMKLDCGTVRRYLKNGVELGWCNYDAKEEMIKIATMNGKKCNPELTIDNVTQRTIDICRMWSNGIHSSSDIAEYVGMASRSVLVHLKNGAKIGICDYSVESARKYSSIKASSKIAKNVGDKVMVVGYDRVFNSAIELHRLSKDLFGVNFRADSIRDVCKGKTESYKGYKFEYVL